MATQLLGSGHVAHGWLGIEGETHADGALVRRVMPGSPAESVGLTVGDVITSVDGAAITSMAEIVRRVRAAEVGDVVSLRVLRSGTSMDVRATLADKPQTS